MVTIEMLERAQRNLDQIEIRLVNLFAERKTLIKIADAALKVWRGSGHPDDMHALGVALKEYTELESEQQSGQHSRT